MTIQEMYDWFDVLQDKYNTPYFLDEEKASFLEDAMWNIINESVANLEKDKVYTERISTLLKPNTITTNSGGLLFIPNNVAVVSLALASGSPLHPMRHNDIGKAEDNTYKKGTASYPNYTTTNGGYQTYPSLNSVDIDAVYVLAPSTIVDLPVHMHFKQVAMAMVKTGFVTEDQALTMMASVTNG